MDACAEAEHPAILESVLLGPGQNLIQAIGIAIPKTRAEKIVESLSRIGGCRICPIGEMQRPP